MSERKLRYRASSLVVLAFSLLSVQVVNGLAFPISHVIPTSLTIRQRRFPPSTSLLILSSQLDASAEADIGPTVLDSSNSGESNVDFEAYAKGYKTAFHELPFNRCAPSMGAVPVDLVGTYYKCGPAMFSAGSIPPPKTSIIQPREGPPVPDGQNPKRMVKHPFEGDGAMLAVTFRPSNDDGGDQNEDLSDAGPVSNESVTNEFGEVSSMSQSKVSPHEVTARFRYVRTVGFTNERRKGQRLYKSMDVSDTTTSCGYITL